MAKPELGRSVIFVDPKGKQHDALVTAVWSDEMINLVYVSSDENRKDTFGRQTEHATSVHYKAGWQAHGNYFMFEGEEPLPYAPPTQV